ncbi:hypothetical protein CF386_09135 [Paraphotobacterium marinum]|uniref:Acyltransferase 3 domain-containing protein n=1 Tax=Paraphotobacterium marinum TaxID=1755811 RepID=A0A220VFR6_9GAMM|nr:acyltransferase [Paraphotobacterium marinum]ASK79224.1 hypothetical protein CF386_09135 [Paraphotobacterium marinum]
MKNNIHSRLDYLDNIKWFLAIIVIMHHSFDYFRGVYPKYSQEFGRILCFNQSYFMDLFFFISAFFIIPSFLKKGKSAFNKDKMIRLGGAVLIYVVTMDLILSKIIWGSKFTLASFISWYYEHIINLQWGDFMGVTWFCWTLLIFTLVWSQFVKTKNIEEKSNKPLPSLLKIFIFCSIMTPINLIALKINGVSGDGFLGFHLIKYFPTYIAAFVLGIQAYQNNWLDEIDFKYGIFGLVMFTFFYCFENGFITGRGFDDSIFRTFCAIGMILFQLYIFKTFFNHSNKVTKVLARASFPAYVFQFIFLVALFKFLQPVVSWNPWIITLVIGVISIVGSFILGIILYRLPFFRRIF